MKISEAQRDIIVCMAHRAALSVQELAAELPYKAHIIRRSLEQLIAHKVVHHSIICDFYKLGYTPHNLSFSLATRDSSKKTAILNQIIRHPQIMWLGGITGELPYELTFLARTLREFTNFIDQLTERFGVVFEKKRIGSEVSQSYFGPKFMSSKRFLVPTLTLQECDERIELDNVDCTLMYYLCANGKVPLVAIAKKLGLPISTIAYRKSRLHELGVLVEEILCIDRDRFVPVSLHLMVSVAEGTSGFRENLMRFCKEEPHCFCCHRCIGNWDYKISIQGEDLSSSTATLEKFKDTFGAHIASLDVVSVVRHYKSAFFPFHRELQQVTKVPALERNFMALHQARRVQNS